MLVSQKCQYAIRAIFEMAKHYGEGTLKIADIAKAQAIPARFLEVILSELRQAGFVESRRGKAGGYFLAHPARELTVGQIIRFIEGPIAPVTCINEGSGDNAEKCPLTGSCVFLAMWERASRALSEVYDQTTFQNLVEEEGRMQTRYVSCYSI